MTSATFHKSPITQFTDICFEDQISASVKSAKSELRDILFSLKDKTATVSYGGQIVTAAPTDFPRLLAEWGTKTKVQLAVRNIVTSALFSAEEKCSGSAIVAAGLWVSGETLPTRSGKKRCTHREMKDCLAYFGGSGLSLATALAVIDLGGLGCKIDYEENQQPESKIIAHSGRVIFGEVDHLFGDKVGRQFDLRGCAAVAVLGTVESVSSLHFALESSAERPVVVLAEKFLPDVSNTLAENWKQGKGKCLPFAVRNWSVENFLDLEKQGILCVSRERGDTFSGLKLESNSELCVSTSVGTCTVSGGQEQVTSKLTVEISQSLGGMTGLVKDRVKMLVGLARQCARGGVVRWENLSEASYALSECYSRELAISAQSLAAGAKASESLKKVLQGLGCVILTLQGAKE